MVGIIFFGTMAGRPGEWALLIAAQVKKMIDAGADFLICRYHKTVKTYGEAGKYVPNAVAKAMRVYLDLPRDQLPMDSGDSFWHGGAPTLAVSLQEFGELFEFGFVPTATLIRKAYTTTVGELVTERAQNLVSRVQYHSQRTSGKYRADGHNPTRQRIMGIESEI